MPVSNNGQDLDGFEGMLAANKAGTKWLILYNCTSTSQTQSTRAKIWFPREPSYVELTEMTMVATNYDYTLTPLLMPDAEWRLPQYDDGEPEEDTFDRFINNGQFPVR